MAWAQQVLLQVQVPQLVVLPLVLELQQAQQQADMLTACN
jgi:hypothetical protein